MSGYRAVAGSGSGGSAAWQLRHSFAGLTQLSGDTSSHPLTLHILPAARALALVTATGLVAFVSIAEPSAAAQTIHLVRQHHNSVNTSQLTHACNAAASRTVATPQL